MVSIESLQSAPPEVAPEPTLHLAEAAPPDEPEHPEPQATPMASTSDTAATTEGARDTSPPAPPTTSAAPVDVPPPDGPRVAPLPAPSVARTPSEPEPAPAEPGEAQDDASATWRDLIASIDIDEPPPVSSIDRAQLPEAASSLDRAHLLDAESSVEAEEQRDGGDAAREAIGWEFEAMTTRAYAERRRAGAEPDESGLPVQEPPDVPPADDFEELEELEELMAGDSARRTDFPLDAFIVPGGAHHLPAGYESRIAHLIAEHLEGLAAQLRRDGLSALGGTHAVDELSRVLAAIVAGYIARGE